MNWSLYGIIDVKFLGQRNIRDVAYQMILGGATLIQYRDKVSDTRLFYDNAKIVQEVCKEHHIPFIVNDRVDIALALEADGVHIGQRDLPFEIVRKLVPKAMLIGVSISSAAEFDQCPDADYYGIGAIFPTKTKSNATVIGLDLIRSLRLRTFLPLIGIGGIQAQNAAEVIRAGCNGIAVISAILCSENIYESTRTLRRIVDNAGRLK